MIFVDLHGGDLGYLETRVEYRFCREPQAYGPYEIRAFIMINGHELEIFEQLRKEAKQYIVNEINRLVEDGPLGAA
jgi:hypothetical protein